MTVDGDSDGSPDEVTVNKFKNKKLVKSLVYSDPKKKPERVIKYKYDSKGRMTRMKTERTGEQRDQNEKAVAKELSQRYFGGLQGSSQGTSGMTFSYNHAGELDSRRSDSTGLGGLTFSESYQYNDNGEVIARLTSPPCIGSLYQDDKETYVRKNGKITQGVSKCYVTTYSYDSSGRLMKSHARSTIPVGKPDIIRTYEYDKQGNLAKVVRKVVTNAQWKGDSVTKQTVSTTTYDFSCWRQEE